MRIAAGCGVRLPPGLCGFSADLTRPETLGNLPGPFDVVFYTAGADHRSEPGYRSAYLQGLGSLIGVLRGQNPPVRRLFFTSSTAVYGQSGGEWVDEDSPAAASHFRGACSEPASSCCCKVRSQAPFFESEASMGRAGTG